MNNIYSPYTFEHIVTEDPADWMAYASVPAPEYNHVTQGCFWRGDAWEVADSKPNKGPVPSSVSRRQGRLALLQVGRLNQVEDAIAAISDPAQKMAAQIEYEANTWARDNDFLKAMWADLGGTEEELDDLFRLAVTL